jgi:hypothetical protein
VFVCVLLTSHLASLFFCRLPRIRDYCQKLTVPVTDDHTLLVAMLASESAITGATYKAGYSNVNLNPDTELPIEVWLSKISEQLTAAGESSRLISSDYSPTDEEVMLEHGKAHLRAIKVPPMYAALDSASQKIVLKHFSQRAFNWTPEAIKAAPFSTALGLTAQRHLYDLFKFVNAMREAVELGVADEGAPVPDWSLSRLRNAQLQKACEERKQPTLSSNDIGVGQDTALPSYFLGRLPGETNEDHFTRLCLHRVREDGKLKPPSFLEITDDQMSLIEPSQEDLSVGAFLKEAAESYGKKMGKRRMNFYGEVPGLCRVANTESRLAKLDQVTAITSTLDALLEGKKALAAENKNASAAKTKETEETRRKLASLMGLPTPRKNFVAADLKKYITDNLEGAFPAVSKSRNLTVVVPYLLAVHAKLDPANGVPLPSAALLARAELEQKLGAVVAVPVLAAVASRKRNMESSDDEEEVDDEEEDAEWGEEEDDEVLRRRMRRGVMRIGRRMIMRIKRTRTMKIDKKTATVTALL